MLILKNNMLFCVKVPNVGETEYFATCNTHSKFLRKNRNTNEA